MEVEDLFTDLADGKKLLKLLEIISGEKLGKPNSGKMRVHKVENVNKSLAFLHTKVRWPAECLLGVRTAWNRAFGQPLIPHVVKQLPAFYRTRCFITVFTAARHLSFSRARLI
jgi:hypothetical protein